MGRFSETKKAHNLTEYEADSESGCQLLYGFVSSKFHH